jgi:hypothetical protein
MIIGGFGRMHFPKRKAFCEYSLNRLIKTTNTKIAKNQQCHYDYFKSSNDEEAWKLFQAILGGTDSILDYLETNFRQ